MRGTFSSGKEAMAFLLGKDNPTPASKIQREIDEAMATYKPVLSPSNARPVAPLPAGRRGAGVSRSAKPAKPARASSSPPRSTKKMSAKEYLASLAPPLTRRGKDSSSVKQIAARVRDELAGGVEAGAFPPGTKFSVRSDHNSMSIDITHWEGQALVNDYAAHVMAPTRFPWQPERTYSENRHNDPRLVPALNDAIDLTAKIADRHNYDNSDSQSDYFDVGYYLHLDARPVIEAAQEGLKLEADPAFAELMQRAIVAANALGPAATKSICGGPIARCGEYNLKHLLKVAQRAGGKPVAYDKQRRGWFPVG